MLDVTSVHWALFTAIASDATVVNSGFTVQFEPLDNQDFARSPWVGVYLDNVEMLPGAMGGLQWDTALDFSVLVSAHDANGRVAAIQALQRAIPPVLTAIHCNITLGGQVDVIDRIAFVPQDVNRKDEDFVQFYEIQVVAKKQVRP